MSQTLALPGLGKKTVVFPNKRHNYGKLRAKLEEEFRKLQSQHGTFELLPYCKAKLHFFSSRGIHNKKPTAKKKDANSPTNSLRRELPIETLPENWMQAFRPAVLETATISSPITHWI